MIQYEFLSESNVDKYIAYLKRAMSEEPDMMMAEAVDEEGIRSRVKDAFYQNTKSILAFDEDAVVGRLEYHFYGCMQDGYKMAYVDWVYVLQAYRHKGVARQLFSLFEKECISNAINQYYLFRAENDNAKRFYDSFEQATTDSHQILRKDIAE